MLRYLLASRVTSTKPFDSGNLDNGALKEGSWYPLPDQGPSTKVNVGPVLATHVPDCVRANVVVQDIIPVVLFNARMKVIDRVEQYQEKYSAMVPHNKHFGIVCAGFYTLS